MTVLKPFFLLASLCVCLHATAQNKQLLYDFNEIPQSLLVNPGGKVDYLWYGGVPLLSGISFQGGSSGLSVNDIFADDGQDINDKIRDRAIGGMRTRDELSGTYQIDLLNGGFRGNNRNIFYSFGIYNEGDAIGYWFRDYAILAVDGNADRLNERFDLSHLKTRGEMLNVFHFGVNKRMSKSLILGGRAKVYSNIFDLNSTGNKGYFVTTEGQNNLLASTLNADLRLRTSGIEALLNASDNEEVGSTLIKRGFFGGSLGLGLDFGFTYHFSEQLLVTGSLLDLGFVYHNNDVTNYTLNGSATIEGVEIILPGALLNPDTDFWQELVDDVETLIPFQENKNNYIAFRPTKLYSSVRYDFGEQIRTKEDCECDQITSNSKGIKYANSLGGQVYAINRPRGPQSALTAFYMRRLGNTLAMKTTYTVDKFSKTNIGLGVSLQLGKVNFYAMADNLLAYRNLADTHYASFQFGFNIISWGKN